MLKITPEEEDIILQLRGEKTKAAREEEAKEEAIDKRNTEIYYACSAGRHDDFQFVEDFTFTFENLDGCIRIKKGTSCHVHSTLDDTNNHFVIWIPDIEFHIIVGESSLGYYLEVKSKEEIKR